MRGVLRECSPAGFSRYTEIALNSVVSCSSVQPSNVTGSGKGESASVGTAREGTLVFFLGGIELWVSVEVEVEVEVEVADRERL